MPYTAPAAAKPTKAIFDPFNSSATGHQRAENRLGGSTSWRESRSLKLKQQFVGGAGGGRRVNDTVGAGSLQFGQDGRKENGGWEKGAKGLRRTGQQSLWESMKVAKNDVNNQRSAKRVKTEPLQSKVHPSTVVSPFTPFKNKDGSVRESSSPSTSKLSPSDLLEPINPISPPNEQEIELPTERNEVDEETEKKELPAPQIFTNLTIYINGSTAPISDHKLKHVISTHGGNMSISLGRRTTTHVILGKTNTNGGCGGGLAGSKIQKEIAQLRGKNIRFVAADWVVESVKAGKRLPESKFEAMKMAPKGVASINSMFKAKEE